MQSGPLISGKVSNYREKGMKILLLLVGMVLIVEGIPYVASPESMKEWLRRISEMKAEHLRVMGLLAMSSGLLICWFVQRSGFFM